MNASITLVAVTGPQKATPARVPVRPLGLDDLPELAGLWRQVYASGAGLQRGGDSGWIGASMDERGGRTAASDAASLVTSGPDGQITAAIIVTELDGEAVIDELFTHPDHRRQGLAEELLRHCMGVLHTSGRTTVKVTVDANNSAAMALYLSRDFRRVADTVADADYD
jgi:ribosomal protein S18 acetylase RimI-like enzyme